MPDAHRESNPAAGRRLDFGHRFLWVSAMPPAALVIALLAVLSTPVVLFGGSRSPSGSVDMWTFAPEHFNLYKPIIAEWNEDAEPRVDISLLGMQALSRRTMDGFLADIPTAPLIEVEVRLVGTMFAGPVESVGFVDLTERLRAEGLLDQINPPSFSPWTKGGRIFGLPHDVHPVMLGYNAELTDRFGVDLQSVETWDEFADAMRALQTDDDGDGEPDRYAISFWPTIQHTATLEMLMLQAGGGVFDASERVVIASDPNAMVLSKLVGWTAGPGRIAADAPEFDAAGNRMMTEGYVASAFAPDWMCNVWKSDLGALSGKMRLMPLPAWEPGGRRTSVRGGTMLGIARTAPNTDELWAFAKHLYLDPELARETFRRGSIISPVRSMWDDPVYDEPDPFFQNQPKGRMYIELAGEVPVRANSPYNTLAMNSVMDAFIRLRDRAIAQSVYNPEALRPYAAEELARAQEQVERAVARNVFLAADTDDEPGATR